MLGLSGKVSGYDIEALIKMSIASVSRISQTQFHKNSWKKGYINRQSIYLSLVMLKNLMYCKIFNFIWY